MRLARRLAAYWLAALGVFPAMLALRFLNVGMLLPAALLGCTAAAFWLAAFRVDRHGT